MLQTTRLERYSGNGLVAKRHSQNFSKFNEHGAPTCPFNCRAISKSFSNTLSEMTPNISDIKQKIRTMSEKKTTQFCAVCVCVCSVSLLDKSLLSGAAIMLLMLLFLIFYSPLACYNDLSFCCFFDFSCCPINQSIFWTRLSLGGCGGSSSSWSLQASRSSATMDRCSAGMPR